MLRKKVRLRAGLLEEMKRITQVLRKKTIVKKTRIPPCDDGDGNPCSKVENFLLSL